MSREEKIKKAIELIMDTSPETIKEVLAILNEEETE